MHSYASKTWSKYGGATIPSSNRPSSRLGYILLGVRNKEAKWTACSVPCCHRQHKTRNMALLRALGTPTEELAAFETIANWYSDVHVPLERSQSHSTTTGISSMAFRVIFVNDVQHTTLWDNEQVIQRNWYRARVHCELRPACEGPYTTELCACSCHTLSISPASCTTTRTGGMTRATQSYHANAVAVERW